MHHAKVSGLYSDRVLARAVFNLLTLEEQTKHPLPKSGNILVNSKYFHPLFTKNCPSTTGE